MSKAKPRPPTLSNSLKVEAGPTTMQKVLKQNLHKIAIYKNKPRPALFTEHYKRRMQKF